MSIIELVVYGLVGYGGLLGLLSTAFKSSEQVGTSKSGAIVRSVWVLPSIYCLIMLAGLSGTVYLDEGVDKTEIGYNVTDGSIITNSTVTASSNTIILVNPIWGTVHIIFYMILILYFIINIVQLLVKRE